MKKGTVWITLGLVLLVLSLVLAFHNIYEDHAAGEYSETVLVEMNHLLAKNETPDKPDSGKAAPEEPQSALTELPAFVLHPTVEMPTVLIDDYRYIGVIAFPELDLSFPVMEEWDYDRLKIAPCLFAGSVYQNDAVICGHNYNSHFALLNDVAPGLCAVFTDVDGNRFTYSLSYIDILQPDNVEAMTGENETWDLTVFTCTVGGKTRTTLRFVLTEVLYSEKKPG